MGLLEVARLSKSFGDERAVDRVSFAAEHGEILCLLGPSGCGKTTLLRLIAGVEDADDGTVVFDGESLEGMPPQQRGFGLMFQDLALFPHMDVFGNVAFGLRMLHVPRESVREKVHELLSLVDLEEHSQRRVHELSGGERQRVALARSLAPAPRVLMLDEPLGALDRALRDSLQSQVRAILKEVGVTSIYVTHDRDEAFAMADRLLLMNGGRLVQTGTPEQVFAAPGDEFVARSLGFSNILPGVVLGRGEAMEIECALGVVTVSGRKAPTPADREEVLLLIDERGIAVSDATSDSAEKNVFRGTVIERVFRGATRQLRVRVGHGELTCLAFLDGSSQGGRLGQKVSLTIDPGAVKLLGPARGEG